MGKYRNPRLDVAWCELVPPGPGMALIKVLWVGVCGSDLHAVQPDPDGYSSFSGPSDDWQFGIQFGHEFVGEVVQCGPDVDVPVGTFVTGDSLVACKRLECQACRSKLWNCCPESYLIGFQADGVFGEFGSLPAKCLYPIDELISRHGFEKGSRAAVLAEPLGVGLHAFQRADQCVQHFERSVLIHGGGMIGIAIAIAARRRGYAPIVISEPNAVRADHARRFADYVKHPDDLEPEFQINAFGVDGPALSVKPTLVVEACGGVEIEKAIEQVAPGGVVVTVARTGQRFFAETDFMITNEKNVQGARGHVGCVPDALSILASGEVDPDLLISRELRGLDELIAALRKPESFADDVKVVCKLK